MINNPRKGIVPRGIILEAIDDYGNPTVGTSTSISNAALGVIVVGLNPGESGTKERYHYRHYFKHHGRNYQSVTNWHKKSINTYKYHSRLRKLIQQLNRTNILWTEIAKCENRNKKNNPCVETLHFCSGIYLKNEIDGLLSLSNHNNKWLILGIGRDAWKALAFLYPREAVIGIPHPTGSWGYYSKLFSHNGQLLRKHFNSITAAITTKHAIWLE
ncbi:uracil-DNA glycosylase family protein [Paludibacterium denitrificans]|uniref:uracil-DNA glycosylase family protein n=1 Tax=Paludibacterium denitrificans TaxID=2675226 RepID=UPI001E56A8B5|nr:uracil-DNA glycosylase family protein [Paludibacterium denitrificans]